MRRIITYMAQQATGLNLLLAVLLFLLVNATVLPVWKTGARFALPSPKSGPSGELEETAIADVDPADYAIVARDNFFHPERRFPIPGKKETMVATRPEIVLYGTYIASGVRLAFIEEKGSPTFTPGRGQRHSVLKIGEKVAGFELKQIETDRITLLRDKETVTVLLRTKKQRSGGANQQPIYGAGRPPAGVGGQQFGTGQSGAGTLHPVVPAQPPPPRPAPVPMPALTPPPP